MSESAASLHPMRHQMSGEALDLAEPGRTTPTMMDTGAVGATSVVPFGSDKVS